jgi:hypothetical protein
LLIPAADAEFSGAGVKVRICFPPAPSSGLRAARSISDQRRRGSTSAMGRRFHQGRPPPDEVARRRASLPGPRAGRYSGRHCVARENEPWVFRSKWIAAVSGLSSGLGSSSQIELAILPRSCRDPCRFEPRRPDAEHLLQRVSALQTMNGASLARIGCGGGRPFRTR